MLQSYCFDYTASILIGFYFVIIGYYFLLFAFFLVVRFRKTKKQYWLFFSLFFLLLALSGGFFVITDFYIPAPANLPAWRIATMFAWLAVACMVEILAILLFTGEKPWVRKVKIGLPLFYVGVAVVVLLLPDAVVCQGCAGEVDNTWLMQLIGYAYPEGRFWLNVVILPVTTILFPILFIYLGIKSVGVIRRSSLLNGIGFLLYFLGRLVQPFLQSATSLAIAIIPPALILVSLLILAIANQFEH